MNFSIENIIAFVVLSFWSIKFIVEMFRRRQDDRMVTGALRFKALAAKLFPGPWPDQTEKSREKTPLGSRVDVVV